VGTNPTILFVHGAWYRPAFWDGIRDRMAARGFPTAAVRLRTCGDTPHSPLGDLYDDIAAVRRAIDEIDGPVVVVAHSYGGLPATDGAAGVPEVRALVYVASFVLAEQQTLLSVLDGQVPEWWVYSDDGRYLRPDDPVAAFLNHCDAETAARAAEEMTYFSAVATTQPIRHAAWRDRPAAYIASTDDTHLPLAAQQAMAAPLTRTYVMETDHSPFLSHPDELADRLATALRDLEVTA